MISRSDAVEVDAVLAFDPAWITDLRSNWLQLIDAAVWDDPAMQRLGDAPRLRKRLLELGERLKSLVADRRWIPHPRERLKSALAAAAGVRDTLGALESLLAGLVPGPGAEHCRARLQGLQQAIDGLLPARENAWAQLLDAQLGD